MTVPKMCLWMEADAAAVFTSQSSRSLFVYPGWDRQAPKPRFKTWKTSASVQRRGGGGLRGEMPRVPPLLFSVQDLQSCAPAFSLCLFLFLGRLWDHLITRLIGFPGPKGPTAPPRRASFRRRLRLAGDEAEKLISHGFSTSGNDTSALDAALS